MMIACTRRSGEMLVNPALIQLHAAAFLQRIEHQDRTEDNVEEADCGHGTVHGGAKNFFVRRSVPLTPKAWSRP